jgi:UDP-N-acetylmuramoyl-L-alanyl-D-glutamate--2,6-diaminopimelate ligase
MAGLKRMGMTHVAYEASSHGLDQHRAEGVPLAAAAFTNFSRDHLDYHGTMDAYFEAKMRLFERLLPQGKRAVIWTDDPKSDEVAERAKRTGHELMTVGRKGETIRLVEQTPTALGQTLILEHAGKSHRLALPLIGAYQASNVLTAAGLVLATGGDWNATFSAMQRVAPVRGRLERAVISRAGVPVYVDYAHTPDALEAAIAALRPHVEGRLITVFGAGGDRDQGKRPEMGAVASRLSDVVIVTDDNPRSEDPATIRSAIMAGATGATEVGGRREAIAEAIRIARSGDIVLVAGKGHETGQIIGDRVLPFDDALVARECAA